MNNFKQAQRAYDNQLPDDYDNDDPDSSVVCKHKWVVVKSVESKGETLNQYKCSKCGAIDHD